MYALNMRNVNHALVHGLNLLKRVGVKEQTRAGECLVSPWPVTTHYQRPLERVLYDPQREANPFFHFFESLWMLAGRNDVQFLAYFNKRMAEYSDDGDTLAGAYGYRWRNHFGWDQLKGAIEELKANPGSRRVYLAHWDATRLQDPVEDFLPVVDDFTDSSRKDLPCNLGVMFMVRDGKLTMTVPNRSNDAIWGAYGANAVHFSYLQEYVAGMIGLPVGSYWQVSNNFHAYTANEQFQKMELRAVVDFYETGEVRPYGPLVKEPSTWDKELEMFLETASAEGGGDWNNNPFFVDVAEPLMRAWDSYDEYRSFKKPEALEQALTYASQCKAEDWALGAKHWLRRRRKTP